MESYYLNEKAMGLKLENFLDTQSLIDFEEEVALAPFNNLKKYFYTEQCRKVLVVEDDFTQLGIIEDLIAEINPEIEVDWEIDAERAINRIVSASHSRDKREYNLVISDIFLGEGSSGVEIYRYCNEYEPRTKVVLISAQSKAKLRNSFFKNSEPLEYLQKPLNFKLFYQKLAPILTA